MRLWVYIVRRVLLVIPVVIGVMTITFALVSSLPISERLISYYGPSGRLKYTPTVPCATLYPGSNEPGNCTNPIWVKGVAALGLNKPIPEQWAIYVGNSLTGNWGYVGNKTGVTGQVPIAAGQPVIKVLGWFLPYTLELAALSLLIILLIAIPIGNLSAVNRNRPVDQAARVLSFSGFALPAFLLGSVLLMAIVLAVGNHSLVCSGNQSFYLDLTGSWPPPQCWPGGNYPSWLVQGAISSPTGFPTVDAVIHGNYWFAADTVIRMLLPAFVIAYGTVALLLRFVRNSMLEVLNLDFVRTARAKGLPEKTVVNKHAGRNSLNVTITVLGLTFAGFISGFPIIEEVFQLNGVGRMIAFSVTITPYDFGMIFGSTILFTLLVVAANIIVDVLYAFLDPRVRLG